MGAIRVFVAGATGNVGRLVAQAVREEEDLELVGGFSTAGDMDLGEALGQGAWGVRGTGDLPAGLAAAHPDVAVDFTSARIVMDALRAYAEAGLDAVIGTTGFDEAMLEEACRLARGARVRWAIVANFGLGINLVAEFLERIREHYPYASVVDRHPARMANAPSGTAMVLAEAASGGSRGAVASREVLPGVLGASHRDVPIWAQRLPYPGPYSEHEVTLGRTDEVIRITVQDFSSAVYVPGVLLSIRRIAGLPAGTVVTTLAEVVESRDS